MNKERIKLIIIYLGISVVIALVVGIPIGWNIWQIIAAVFSSVFLLQFINSYFDLKPLRILDNGIIGSIIYLIYLTWSIYFFIIVYMREIRPDSDMPLVDGFGQPPRVFSFFVCILPSLPFIISLIIHKLMQGSTEPDAANPRQADAGSDS